jgi:hypothetical protein
VSEYDLELVRGILRRFCGQRRRLPSDLSQ